MLFGQFQSVPCVFVYQSVNSCHKCPQFVVDKHGVIPCSCNEYMNGMYNFSFIKIRQLIVKLQKKPFGCYKYYNVYQ